MEDGKENKTNEELITALKQEYEIKLSDELKKQEERFAKEKKELEERHIREMTALLKSGNLEPVDEKEIKKKEEKSSFETAVETITENILRRF